MLRGRGAAYAIALALFTIALHASALRGWWLYDDPQLILEAGRQSLSGLFFNPGEYVHLAAHTFVPLQLVSYKLDLLFGVHPAVFYAHQLLALTAAVVLLFYVLRQHVDERLAALGAALFSASWAATYAARTLMIRHYVEGLVLALVALWFWPRRPVVSSLFYFLALLAKEVYAPLPLLFALSSRRVKPLVAPAIALVVYLVWRWRMTQLIGGYAALPQPRELLALPRALWSHLVGPATSLVPSLLWAAAVLALVVMYLVHERARGAVVLAAIAIVALAPIVPLAANFEWRYSFAAVACFIGGLTLAASASGRGGRVVLALLVIVATLMSLPQRRGYEEQTRVIEAEGRYIATQPPSAPALAATSPEWYLGGLAQMRGTPAPRYFFSRFAITAGDADGSHAVTIDAAGRAVPLASAATFGTPSEWAHERQLLVADAPLSVSFTLAHNDISWRIGPPGGDLTFITSPSWTAIPIPAQGSRRVPAARERQWFRIRRAAPDGTWTISPVLPVPREGETTRWSRP
jgi:hypothetical protein